MKKQQRRNFLTAVLASLAGIFFFRKKKEKYHIPVKPLKEADFYKKHDLAG